MLLPRLFLLPAPLRRSKALVLHFLPPALALCSGAAFLRWVAEIRGSHFDFIQGYGMTESTAIGTRHFNIEECRKISSIGLLAPNMQAKVLGCKTGSFLPPGSSGELLLRGLSNPKGREDSHFHRAKEDLQSMSKAN